MNSRSIGWARRSAGSALALLIMGCEPPGWFERDLGALLPNRAEMGTIHRTASAAPPLTQPVAEPAALARLEEDLRRLVDEAREHAQDPAVDAPNFEIIEDEQVDSLPQPFSWIDDPTLQADPEARLFIALAREIAALRNDVDLMRQQMDGQLGSFVRDLKNENLRLRRELQRLYTARRGDGAPLPVLPGGALWDDIGASSWPEDNQSLVSDVHGEFGAGSFDVEDTKTHDEFSGPRPADQGPVALVGSSALSYAVLVEWGRTPDNAAAAGGQVASLRGMIVVVPEGTGDSALAALGQQLYDDYRDYDNVNVRVFDRVEAAQTYAQSNSTEDGGPVMHVSKFSARNEHFITIFRDGKMTQVPVPGQ